MVNPELTVIGEDNEVAILEQLGVDAHITAHPWDSYWQEFIHTALYAHGADVSQVGAPSTGAVVAMNALRSFNAREIARFGGSDAFLLPCWQSTQVRNEPGIWAVPYWADVDVVFYWRDMLDEAGLNEEVAFRTAQQFEDTLERLYSHGIQTPWGYNPFIAYTTLHLVASWIWGAGGDIVHFEGNKLVLLGSAAMQSIRAFLRLKQYMPPDLHKQSDQLSVERLFLDRKIVITFGNPPGLGRLQEALRETPELLKQLGISLPPGPAYVGGSNLVVWKHTHHERQALDLVEMLTSKEFQIEYCKRTGYLPTRFDALEEAYYTADPYLKVMLDALKTGRTYPNLRRWGLIEERLSTAFQQIWYELYNDPDANPDSILEQHLDPLKARLELSLNPV